MKIVKAKIAIRTIGFLIILVFCGLRIYSQETTGSHPSEPLYIFGTPIYAVKSNGDLMWYKHIGFKAGSSNWGNNGLGKQVGTSWAANLFVFKGNPKGEDGVIYRVDRNGDLYWYKHNGSVSGSSSWEDGKKIGGGFNGKQVFSGGNGVIYMVNNTGELFWYEHLGYETGIANWANKGVGKKVGEADILGQARVYEIDRKTHKVINSGFNKAKFVFSGGRAIIYMIDDKGDLYRNKHLGIASGTNDWDVRKKIGSGWKNFGRVFSGGITSFLTGNEIGGTDEIIYAVENDGTLYWYQLNSLVSGSSSWNKNSGSEIGDGWKFDFVF